MKIYTKGGDKGETSLYGGRRLSKDNIKIEAYGTVDELNSFIGLLASGFKAEDTHFLLKIQNNLFNCGAALASDPEKANSGPEPTESDVLSVENEIDNITSQLEPLKSFILPGGSIEVSYAHICRTVCRRAERRVISLSGEEYVNPIIIKYLNEVNVKPLFIRWKLLIEEMGFPTFWESDKKYIL